MNPSIEKLLQPGDVLLYSPKGLFGWVISIKTWHSIAHCETYVGDGKAVASRDGIGVGLYDLRTDRLVRVLRPIVAFDLTRALQWFESEARGQGYDWLGLLRFGWRAPVEAFRFQNKMFCSEFTTRLYRAGGLDPFNGEDADAVPPFLFSITPVFKKVEF